MSPLMPAGTRGYQDYQRIDNYDGDSLWVDDPGVINQSVFSPVLDCSRFAYVCGFLRCTLGSAGVQLQWFLDLAATITVGTRTLRLDANIISVAQVRIVCLGPFMRVTLSPVSVGNYHPAANLFLSNRNYPLELVPTTPTLLNTGGSPIAAGVIQRFYPTDYYAGPAHVSYTGPNAGVLIGLEYLDSTGAWQQIDAITPPSTAFGFNTVLPAGAWRAYINNTSAGSITPLAFSITQSQTGGT